MQEQGEHLKSTLAALAELQDSNSESRRCLRLTWTNQADGMLHRYQALLAQVRKQDNEMLTIW